MAATALTPTDEQQEIIDALVKGENLKIEACAGSGKTSTLRMSAQAVIQRDKGAISASDILYLAYNSEAKKAAERAFPKHVRVSTIHGLAWHGKHHRTGEKLGVVYADRLHGPRVPASRTASLLGIANISGVDLGGSIILNGTTLARMASETVDRFCFDTTLLPKPHHVPRIDGLDDAQMDYLRSEVVPIAKKLWNQLQSISSAHRFTHDYYLKMWALTEPTIDYDTILLDEAQDSNNLVKELITRQRMSQLVAVGDSAQQIYGWRGAKDVLAEWPAKTHLRLSQSFRFGRAVAEEANVWLPFAGSDLVVLGNPAMDSKVVRKSAEIPTAVLCRTNAMAIGRAMEAMAKGIKVAMAGGSSQLTSLIQAADELKSGKRTMHPELMGFASWAELMSYANEPQGKDLGVLVSLVEKYGTRTLLNACKQMVPPSQAQLTVSTVHKSKGLEWSHVEIAPDFREPAPVEDPKTGREVPGPVHKTDAMLAYVAVTRARHVLDNSGLAWVHERAASTGEWRMRQDALKR